MPVTELKTVRLDLVECEGSGQSLKILQSKTLEVPNVHYITGADIIWLCDDVNPKIQVDVDKIGLNVRPYAAGQDEADGIVLEFFTWPKAADKAESSRDLLIALQETQLKKYQKAVEIADALMIEAGQKIDEQRGEIEDLKEQNQLLEQYHSEDLKNDSDRIDAMKADWPTKQVDAKTGEGILELLVEFDLFKQKYIDLRIVGPIHASEPTLCTELKTEPHDSADDENEAW